MKTLRRLAAVAALTLAPAVALAASAQEQLRAFVATVSSATGSFSQYTVNNQGRTQPAQTGVFSFQRPASSSGPCKSPMSSWWCPTAARCRSSIPTWPR